MQRGDFVNGNRATLLIRDDIFMTERDLEFQKPLDIVKNVKHFQFVSTSFYFGAKNGSSASGNLLVARPVLPLRKALV